MNILQGLFSKKQTEDKPQEFRDIKWGTVQPVYVQLGSVITPLRAWGDFSCAVNNHQQFKDKFGDAQGEDKLSELTSHLQPVLVSGVIDVLGEMSSGKSGLAELSADLNAVAAAVKARAEPNFNALGLTLLSVSVLNIQTGP
jgi:membrane protease subunit (stomatin/prohibitin family)